MNATNDNGSVSDGNPAEVRPDDDSDQTDPETIKGLDEDAFDPAGDQVDENGVPNFVLADPRDENDRAVMKLIAAGTIPHYTKFKERWYTTADGKMTYRQLIVAEEYWERRIRGCLIWLPDDFAVKRIMAVGGLPTYDYYKLNGLALHLYDVEYSLFQRLGGEGTRIGMHCDVLQKYRHTWIYQPRDQKSAQQMSRPEYLQMAKNQLKEKFSQYSEMQVHLAANIYPVSAKVEYLIQVRIISSKGVAADPVLARTLATRNARAGDLQNGAIATFGPDCHGCFVTLYDKPKTNEALHGNFVKDEDDE
ncbi:MAG: hypothetical protein WCT54_05680 [Patescibacteria group bacterium]